MTLDEIAGSLGEKLGIPKAQAAQAIHGLTEIIADGLKKGERVALPNLGALSVSDRPARSGRNPRTGEAITIAARKVVKFSATATLGRGINGDA